MFRFVYFEQGDSGRDLLVVFSEIADVRAADENVVLVRPEDLLDVSDVDGTWVAGGIAGHEHLGKLVDGGLVFRDFRDILAIITPFERRENVLLQRFEDTEFLDFCDGPHDEVILIRRVDDRTVVRENIILAGRELNFFQAWMRENRKGFHARSTEQAESVFFDFYQVCSVVAIFQTSFLVLISA